MHRADNVSRALDHEPATTTAYRVAHSLADSYADLVDVELPEALGSLVLLLQEREAPVWKHVSGRRTPPLPTKLVIVVEDDPAVRELAVAMLQETVLDVIACASAEDALAVMQQHADSVAMLFTDVQLAGAMDGVQLACLASRNWPNVRLVVTSGGAGDRAEGLPSEAVYLTSPGVLSRCWCRSTKPSSYQGQGGRSACPVGCRQLGGFPGRAGGLAAVHERRAPLRITRRTYRAIGDGRSMTGPKLGSSFER